MHTHRTCTLLLCLLAASAIALPAQEKSDVAANTFGPVIKITDSLNFGSVPPPMAYNTVTNQAVLGGGDGCFGCLPVMGLADLSTQTGFTVVLPNSGEQQIFSGGGEFDATHKLLFVAQAVSSSTATGSTIYVYDTSGILQGTLNGFIFSNASSVIAMHIALNPGTRTGFVDGPSTGEIQGLSTSLASAQPQVSSSAKLPSRSGRRRSRRTPPRPPER
jgi:hypothetical protein